MLATKRSCGGCPCPPSWHGLHSPALAIPRCMPAPGVRRVAPSSSALHTQRGHTGEWLLCCPLLKGAKGGGGNGSLCGWKAAPPAQQGARECMGHWGCTPRAVVATKQRGRTCTPRPASSSLEHWTLLCVDLLRHGQAVSRTGPAELCFCWAQTLPISSQSSPIRWCQKLCGLDLVAPLPPPQLFPGSSSGQADRQQLALGVMQRLRSLKEQQQQGQR